jgi:hypothetical protein
MKNRILKNWTFRRLLFLSIGIYIITSSIQKQEYIGAFFGLYAAAMGVFAFGCATNCGIRGSSCDSRVRVDSSIEDIHYEEVK